MKVLKGTIRSNVNFEDFAKVFKSFESFPFFEMWTQEDLISEYEFFQNCGIIFGFYTEDNNCIGILTLNPYIPRKHPVNYSCVDKVMYLSDVATLSEYRHHGVGTRLFHYAIRYSRLMGYHYIYLRTNEKNSMSYSIAKKCGFDRISDIIEEVEHLRIDGTIAKDSRIFMEKKL